MTRTLKIRVPRGAARERRGHDLRGDELLEGQPRAAVADRVRQHGHDELDAVDAAEGALGPRVLRVERGVVGVVAELAEPVLAGAVERAQALGVDDGRVHLDAAVAPAVAPRVDDVVVDVDRVGEALGEAPRDLRGREAHAEVRRVGVAPEARGGGAHLDDDLVELLRLVAARLEARGADRGLCGFQIFNPTSMCA